MLIAMLTMLLIMAGILFLAFSALFVISFFSNQCDKKVKMSHISKSAAGVLSSLLDLISCVPWIMVCAFLVCAMVEASDLPVEESSLFPVYGFIMSGPYAIVMVVSLFASFILHFASLSFGNKASEQSPEDKAS